MNPQPPQQPQQPHVNPTLFSKDQHIQLHLIDNDIISLTGVSQSMDKEIKRIKKEKAKITASLAQANQRRDQFVQEISIHQIQEAERAQEHIRKVAEEAQAAAAKVVESSSEVAQEFKVEDPAKDPVKEPTPIEHGKKSKLRKAMEGLEG